MLLGGYAAFQCPVRIWWDHVPGAGRDMEPSAALQRRLDAGNAFEVDVFAALTAAHGADAVLVGGASTRERVDQTLDAMRVGRRLVLGGQLPHDESGGRVGKPDILLRVTAAEVAPRYVPVDVKNYQQFGGRLTIPPRAGESVPRFSTLEEPQGLIDAPQVSNATPHRFKACLQLAHYTRMLESCGFHPGPDWLLGAVIGTSDIRSVASGTGEWVLGWFDLTAPLFASYSRTRQGTVKRSALERYDHEFGFRLSVAKQAADSPTGAGRPVEPIWQKECRDCPYESRCWAEIEGRAHRDVTFETLSVREWKALGDLGISTTAELAAVDLEQSGLLDRLVPEIEQTERSARSRLGRAIRRARLVVAGLPWECTADDVAVPTADIEIDVDMENQEEAGLVYMWGIRRRVAQDDATAVYVDDFHTWAKLDRGQATALAERYFRWLQKQISEAEAAGRTIAFFHWSHPEVSKLRSHLEGTTVTPDEFAAVANHHVDLERFFNAHFFSVRGTGLKNVAPALGFRWPTEDAGGEHSLGVVEQAQSGEQSARDWLLSYNRADTAATAHIRDALRTMDLDAFR